MTGNPSLLVVKNFPLFGYRDHALRNQSLCANEEVRQPVAIQIVGSQIPIKEAHGMRFSIRFPIQRVIVLNLLLNFKKSINFLSVRIICFHGKIKPLRLIRCEDEALVAS